MPLAVMVMRSIFETAYLLRRAMSVSYGPGWQYKHHIRPTDGKEAVKELSDHLLSSKSILPMSSSYHDDSAGAGGGGGNGGGAVEAIDLDPAGSSSFFSADFKKHDDLKARIIRLL